MKNLLTVFFILTVVFAAHAVNGRADTPGPVKVIFDTDMFTDYDDVGALALLHTLADRGEAEILATLSCTRGNASVGVVEIINHYYGRPTIPVGCTKEYGVAGRPNGHEKYLNLLKAYPGCFKYADSDEAPDAVTVYRRVLAAQPDKSVVLCSVGFLTNIRRLLESQGDEISPLDGTALVARKVRLWVAMACRYPNGREFNAARDAVSSRIAVERAPVPILFSDFQYGRDVYAGRMVAEKAFTRNPVHDIFKNCLPSRDAVRTCKTRQKSEQGHCSWDETAVLAAVRGTGVYFGTARGRYTMIGDTGEDKWTDDPNGPHMRLIETMPKESVGKTIDELIAVGAKVRTE